MPVGSKLAKLAMDQASRLKRAREMGFYDNTLYHGTAAKPSTTMDDGNIFDEFNLWEGEDPSRSTVRSPVSKLGVSLGEQPQIAEDFASLASPDGSEGSTILPLKFRAERVGHIDLNDYGDELLNDEVFGAVADAWKDGFDAIQFRNYSTPQGTKGSFVLVKNPNQIRSIHAKFDPDKKGSANLLASLGGGAVLGGAALSSGEAEAAPTAQDLIDQYNAKGPDVGGIRNVPYPKLYKLADLIDEYTESPMGGSWFGGVTDWMRGAAEDREESNAEKYKRALMAGLDVL